MERSQYLAQALQSMGSDPLQQGQSPDLSEMKKIAEARKAFEAANPGQSYVANGMQQMGQNIMGAPAAMSAAPGNVMSGMGDLAKRFGIR